MSAPKSIRRHEINERTHPSTAALVRERIRDQQGNCAFCGRDISRARDGEIRVRVHSAANRDGSRTVELMCPPCSDGLIEIGGDGPGA